MIYIRCNNPDCTFGCCVQVAQDAELGVLADWFPDQYPCPKCGGMCSLSNNIHPTTKVAPLTVEEAVCVFSGGGLPEEQECSATRVYDLLTNNEVVNVHLQGNPSTNRCTIKSLVLSNGCTLHFGASTQGACIYRISEET